MIGDYFNQGYFICFFVLSGGSWLVICAGKDFQPLPEEIASLSCKSAPAMGKRAAKS